MKFKYLGDHKNMVAFGYDFSNGNTPEVDNPFVIKKLQGNSHFEEIADQPVEAGKSGGPTKNEIIKKLTQLGIAHNPADKKDMLAALLPAE